MCKRWAQQSMEPRKELTVLRQQVVFQILCHLNQESLFHDSQVVISPYRQRGQATNSITPSFVIFDQSHPTKNIYIHCIYLSRRRLRHSCISFFSLRVLLRKHVHRVELRRLTQIDGIASSSIYSAQVIEQVRSVRRGLGCSPIYR